LDQLLRQDKSGSRRLWVTFLNREQPKLDERIVAWSKQLGLGRVPVSIFEDDVGPPAYRIPPKAAVVVVFAKQRKVVASYLFASDEFQPSRISDLVQEIRRFFEANPPPNPGRN
jgi:hypothetical protein